MLERIRWSRIWWKMIKLDVASQTMRNSFFSKFRMNECGLQVYAFQTKWLVIWVPSVMKRKFLPSLIRDTACWNPEVFFKPAFPSHNWTAGPPWGFWNCDGQKIDKYFRVKRTRWSRVQWNLIKLVFASQTMQ